MADIWEILWLCNDYSLTTPPYNSAIIQAFQQTIWHAIQRLIYEYYALCYVLLLSYFSVWFWISTPPSHVKLPPDPLQNPAYFLSYLHNIQVFIRTYSWKFPLLLPQPIPYLFRTFSNKETQSNDPPYSAPIPTKKIQSNDLTYSAPIPTKRTQSNNQLFRTYSNKETQSNSPNYSAPFPTKKIQSNDLGRKLGLRLGLIVQRVGERGLIHCT